MIDQRYKSKFWGLFCPPLQPPAEPLTRRTQDKAGSRRERREADE
jgi:hypothetical protein